MLGYEIIINDFLDWDEHISVQAKRHKRKSSRRWQKKWLKRFGYKTEVKHHQKILYRNGAAIMSQTSYNQLFAQMNNFNWQTKKTDLFLKVSKVRSIAF